MKNRSHETRGAVRTRIALSGAIAVLLVACNQQEKTASPSRVGSGPALAARADSAQPGMPGMPGMPGTPGTPGMAGMQMSADGSALLPAAAVKQFGITFDSAAERELQGTLRTVGTVSVDESGVLAVTTKVAGFIERLEAKVTGQRVTRGQVLAEIYSPEVLAAEEELLVAKRLDASEATATARAEPSLLSAARRRLRLLDVSDAQIDEVLRTGRAQRTTPIIAPASGVLTERAVSQGQAVQAGMPLFTIADLSKLWIDVRIPVAAGAGVRDGMSATYNVAGVPVRTYTGRVAYIYPTVGDQSRTLSARVLVRNDDGVLKPGMFATVAIMSPGRRALTVPRAAVIETGERSVVFVDMGGGQLMPHDVEVGAATPDLVEILSGLASGQRVVTSAQFLLESESNLAEVMRSMIGMGTAKGSADTDMKGMDTRGAGAAPAKSPALPRP